MIIGIDFDNTIVCYDEIFYEMALNKGMIPKNLQKVKGEVRNYLRERGKENLWTQLQGYVYGPGTLKARPFAGALDFFIHCRKQRCKVCIISHKTIHPFLGSKYNLHEYAHKWLTQQGFYNTNKTGLSKNNVFFELTKEEKLKRIKKQECTHYIDDLPEFLGEESFPKGVKKILFDPNKKYKNHGGFYRIASWQEMIKKLK